MKKPSSRKLSSSPHGYAPLLAGLKARVRTAQVKAALSVNRELILLYWHIGGEILRAQQAQGWGTKVVERLAHDLTGEFPELGGFSAPNLHRMLGFYAAWAPIEIVQQPVAQLADQILSPPVIKSPKAIESRLHQRSGKAITNFAHTLPPAQSDLAREVREAA